MDLLAYQLAPDHDHSRSTVLVVEDEVLIRLMIADELRKQGLNVIEACSADEALSVLQSSVPVGLLVTDLHMPGKLNGLALARIVRRTFPMIKIVVSSGDRTGDCL